MNLEHLWNYFGKFDEKIKLDELPIPWRKKYICFLFSLINELYQCNFSFDEIEFQEQHIPFKSHSEQTNMSLKVFISDDILHAKK